MAVLGELGYKLQSLALKKGPKMLYSYRSWRVTAVIAMLKRKSNGMRPKENPLGTNSNTWVR